VFSFRWEIVVAFRNTKQTLGIQNAQTVGGGEPLTRRRLHDALDQTARASDGIRAIEHNGPLGFLDYALNLF
jgi:hypothetical protein